MLSPNPLYVRIMRWPWQDRAVLILLITLVAMWLVAQGIRHGLADSATLAQMAESPDWCIRILQDEEHPDYWHCIPSAERSLVLWQRFGPLLTAYGGILIALLAHTVIGVPTTYSFLGRFALVLLILSLPTLFWDITICLSGSVHYCFLPTAFLTLTVYTIHHHRTERLYVGDWVALGMIIVHIVWIYLYTWAWADMFAHW